MTLVFDYDPNWATILVFTLSLQEWAATGISKGAEVCRPDRHSIYVSSRGLCGRRYDPFVASRARDTARTTCYHSTLAIAGGRATNRI